ncbi:MAG: hypothetical protein Q9174_003235 [Haloplaca sp. 1 TL-2023]
MTQTTELWDRRSQSSPSAELAPSDAAQDCLTDAGTSRCGGSTELYNSTESASIELGSGLFALPSGSLDQKSPSRLDGMSNAQLCHNEYNGGPDGEGPELDMEGLENGEQDEDPPYTDGEAQIALASDGVKKCIALLPTADMIAKINQIATRSRRLAYVTKGSKKLRKEITYAENLIEYKKEAIQDTISQVEVAQLNQEIDDMRQRMEEDMQSLSPLEAEIKTLTTNFEYSKAQLQEMLEDVLLRANLLEIPEPEAAEEVIPSARRLPGLTKSDDPKTESPYEEHASPTELDEKEMARNDFEDKREELMRMNEAFENRHAEDAEEKAEYLRCVKQGICSTTQTDFDLSALEYYRGFASRLRKAEESFEDAFRRAKQLGVLDGEDAYYQESIFSGRSDGYDPSFEDAMTASAPVKRISYWQQSIGYSQDEMLWGGTELEPWKAPELESEPLEMEDCEVRSASMSDSWSCVDRSRNRRRINHWREIAGRDR